MRATDGAELVDLLKARKTLVGAAITLPDPAWAELSAAPWDYVMIDMEHSPIALGDLAGLLVATRSAQTFSLVRVPSAQTEHLNAILDAGATGVIVPQLQSASEAAKFVSRLRFPPHGSRGWGPRRTAILSGLRPGAGTISDRVACVVLIETAAAVEAAAEIARVDGIDALLLGANDLSVDYGIPNQVGSDRIRAAANTVQDAADAAGIASGIGGVTPRELLIEMCGVRSSFLLGAADARSHAAALSQTAQNLRNLLQTAHDASRAAPGDARLGAT